MKFAVPAVLLWAASGTLATAQDAGGVLDMTGMGIYAMEDAVMEAAQESVSKRRAARPVVRQTANTRYTPSIERRRANLARFVAKARQKDPTGASQLESTIASTDIIEGIGKEMAAYGLRTDDVADAYTVWWVNAWLATRGRTDTPPKAQVAAIRAQAGQALASTAGFAQSSDASKQELAEVHLIHALLIDNHMRQAKNDPGQLRAVADAVRQGARRSGLDLDSMELTAKGFVPR